jgi:arginine/lysine/ornithine decarboxylase
MATSDRTASPKENRFLTSQTQTPLLDALQACAAKPHAAFYVPGHKRGQGANGKILDLLGSQVFRADLPELPELGNLFPPEGVLKQAQELAAEAFGAKRTWFLVNGSTSGIITGILATCRPGDKIILPRSVHQSTIAGLVLSGAFPIFISPEYNPEMDVVYSVTPESVVAALTQHPNAKAVLVVYPTYQGVCGSLGAIAEVVHRHGIPLLVDEAHGAHFRFHPDLPCSALESGADLAIQSIHKTLGAMTQASMLHLQGDRIDPVRIAQSLQMIQSSSPSNLLMASLDAARHHIALEGKDLLTEALTLSRVARDRLSKIPGVKIFDPPPAPGCHTVDFTRLTLNWTALGLSGFEADDLLHQELGVTAELPTAQNLTFVITIGNRVADIDRLIQGVETLAQKSLSASFAPVPQLPLGLAPFPNESPGISPREAFFLPTERVTFDQAIDRISAELICPYPPGIPLLMPGEVINNVALDYLQAVKKLGKGVTIKGCSDPDLHTLKVVQV